MREGVDFFAGVEVNAVDLVDDVTQQIAADHAVLHTLEDVGDDFALAAFLAFARQCAQVGEQALPKAAVGAVRVLLANEGQQFVAGDAVFACGPVAPAVRRFDDGLVAFAVELGFLRVLEFKVVEELEEHHPGEQRQAIHVAIEALVLAQNLARAADQCGEVVAGGERGFSFGCGHRVGIFLWVLLLIQHRL